MANLIQSLFRIDPTQGLIEYVNTVKPYHTKVLDVLVEYIYTEQVKTTVVERIKWDIDMVRPMGDVQYACGYGAAWGAPSPFQPDYGTIVSAQASDPQSLVPSNSFLVTEPTHDPYDVVVINPTAGQFAVVSSHALIGVNATSRTWTINGDVTSLLAVGQRFHVSDASGAVSSGTYTVAAISLTSGNTKVVVHEVISLLALGSGSVGIPIVFHTFMLAGVDVPTRTWTVVGDVTNTLQTGDVVSIDDSTAGQIRCTVASMTVVSGNTHVQVVEQLGPPLVPTSWPSGVGSLTVEQLPSWVAGITVQFEVGGILPAPLAANTDYHFIPTSTPGIFNLSTTRYPQQYTDYIHVTSVGSINALKQVETFFPGAYVHVTGTLEGRNDGDYVVSRADREGSNVRVHVLQRVSYTTPPSFTSDGAMVFSLQDSYDAPSYCPVSHAPDTFTSAYIHETIHFQYEMSFVDMVSSTAMDTPVGDSITAFQAVSSGNHPTVTAYAVAPHGYDLQSFDVGVMADTPETQPR